MKLLPMVLPVQPVEPILKDPKKEKIKKPKKWYLLPLLLLALILVVNTVFPLVFGFIIALLICGIIPFCFWQMFSFLKYRRKHKTAVLTNANYCKLELEKLRIKHEKKNVKFRR